MQLRDESGGEFRLLRLLNVLAQVVASFLEAPGAADDAGGRSSFGDRRNTISTPRTQVIPLPYSSLLL